MRCSAHFSFCVFHHRISFCHKKLHFFQSRLLFFARFIQFSSFFFIQQNSIFLSFILVFTFIIHSKTEKPLTLYKTLTFGMRSKKGSGKDMNEAKKHNMKKSSFFFGAARVLKRITYFIFKRSF